jgi:hypothetical protein
MELTMSDKNLTNQTISETPDGKTETTIANPSDRPKRSGGPRTPEGKMRSSQNARRHSLTARVHIAPPEEAEIYDAHLNAYLEALAPVGVVERDLALELASLRYRLKRIASIEDSIFAIGHSQHAESLSSLPEAGAALAQGMTWLRDGKSIQLLSLYESRLRKAAEKAQAEIERLQAARKEAHERAMEEAIRLSKLAVHEGNCQYQGGDDFEPAADHGQFVYSTHEIARAADRQERLRRAWSVPEIALKAA